jgi:zinc protease
MKQSWLLLLGLALSACAPSPPPLHVPGPTTSHPLLTAPAPGDRAVRLPSVVLRDKSSRVVTFRVAFSSGSADDPPGKEGLTRLTATTMTEGGTTVRSFAELVEKLYPMAASIDVHVDRDETVFYADVAADSVEAFYPLLKEVILTPRLDDAGFERMRSRARSELVDDLRGANDEAFGKEALAAAIYEGHPYGHPPVGTESGLAAATLDDVRAQRAGVFCRDRVLLGVAGGLPDGFEERFVRDFEALPACPAPRAELPEPRPISAPHLLLVEKPTADSTAISIGTSVDFTRKSADFPAIQFFTDYLGLHRQFNGVLFRELRERRGLNYGDYAYSEFFEQEGSGHFARPNITRRQQMFSIWIRPVRPKNAAFALRGALYFYGKTLDRGIPQADLDSFRGFETRSTALQELTESRRLGHALDDFTYGAKTPFLPGLKDAWKGLDEASLKVATQRHLAGKSLWIAVIARDAAALAAELTGTAPTPASYDTPKPPAVLDEDKDIARSPLGLTKDNVRLVKYTDLFK